MLNRNPNCSVNAARGIFFENSTWVFFLTLLQTAYELLIASHTASFVIHVYVKFTRKASCANPSSGHGLCMVYNPWIGHAILQLFVRKA